MQPFFLFFIQFIHAVQLLYRGKKNYHDIHVHDEYENVWPQLHKQDLKHII